MTRHWFDDNPRLYGKYSQAQRLLRLIERPDTSPAVRRLAEDDVDNIIDGLEIAKAHYTRTRIGDRCSEAQASALAARRSAGYE
ncbi:MAG: hypothetical protein IT307_13345 [Chloroflexi bacterium]|nr:hypothetical protein [Chloroflexota bacterium]